MNKLKPSDILARYQRARDRRSMWESHWQECYDYALPLRDNSLSPGQPGEKKTDHLFDGTAPDAVDQLAASLLGHLTPPGGRWFGLNAGPDATTEARESLADDLDRMSRTLQTHFDRSNFTVEMHQCYLDLVTVGTACLQFEEARVGENSAFRFTAVPLGQVVLEDGGSGRLDVVYRRAELTAGQFKVRFPEAELPSDLQRRLESDPDERVIVIEAVIPEDGTYGYWALLESGTDTGGEATVLRQGRFTHSPFIAFRWVKSPGENYGRSPVMKALPDIKTANKVVELILKNASITVTGIWQADDDGVLNPATIKLAPGTIIPKAVGSQGLTPLKAPGELRTSEIVLESLRNNIRRSLLADKLGPTEGPKMTATEVLERSADMSRLLGATFGRLQAELLNPLLMRAQAILRRRGEIPNLRIDGREVVLRYQSTLVRNAAREEAQNITRWIGALREIGADVTTIVDVPAAARWLGRAFDIPDELVRERDEMPTATALETSTAPSGPAPQGGAEMIGQMLGALTGQGGPHGA
ncbi:portal protein [Magnetospira thiophila]